MNATTTPRITVERRADDFMAYLDGDKARWESGKTATEAIGKLVISHGRALGVSVAVLNQPHSETPAAGVPVARLTRIARSARLVEHPDQAHLDYTSARIAEDAAEADFGGDPWRSRIAATSAPHPERFTWGQVVKVHTVGDDYAIVEYIPRQAANVSDEGYDPSPQFSVYVRGAHGRSWDTSHSYTSLDRALIACIAWKAEQANGGWSAAANSKAVQYVTRMLGIEGES